MSAGASIQFKQLSAELASLAGVSSSSLQKARLAPPFDAEFVGGTTPFVWAQARGRDKGFPIEPLAENATALAREDPALRSVLAAIDALRVERAREREAASNYLANALAQVGAFA